MLSLLLLLDGSQSWCYFSTTADEQNKAKTAVRLLSSGGQAGVAAVHVWWCYGGDSWEPLSLMECLPCWLTSSCSRSKQSISGFCLCNGELVVLSPFRGLIAIVTTFWVCIILVNLNHVKYLCANPGFCDQWIAICLCVYVVVTVIIAADYESLNG